MPTVVFDEEAHIYKVDGKQIDSVTTILKSVGFIETKFFTEEGRDRGHHVHKKTELIDQKNLDWLDVPENQMSYLTAYERFLDISNVEIIGSENIVYDLAYGYIGTYDRLVNLNGMKNVILDIKTGAAQSWWPLQLAAYRRAAMLTQEIPISSTGFSLLLKKNGQFELKEYNLKDAEKVFLGCALVHNHKKKLGIN